MKKILIIGATSSIAQETAKIFATSGAALFLVARNQEKMDILAKDLVIRGATQVETALFDATKMGNEEMFLKKIIQTFGDFDGVLMAHGFLPNQTECERSVEKTLETFQINALSFISLLTVLGNYFGERQKGFMAIITSVAGDRGRQSNYVYAAAKSAVHVFLQGMRQRLFKKGVHLLTIKPGYVDTPMTVGMKKNFLFASPQKIARGIVKAIEKRKDIVYLPWFWRWIMLMVRNIPEGKFKKLSL
ncbi:MAG TPA: short-chain dehydrogenase [Deltaproteobacteria bacterium]|nr:MAG: short-chain dehydrogenase [Deltaproteobacteria bacterium GWA2_45_12]HBF13820.1 short-chain dehydrogenase [Deltaproteobacteria bacterium]